MKATALFRIEAKSSVRRRAILAAILLMVLMAPKAVAPAQGHEFWVGMWEGLGDFDREHGHAWSAWDARIALDTEGYSMARALLDRGNRSGVSSAGPSRSPNRSPLVLKILVHRAFATITQCRSCFLATASMHRTRGGS